MAKNVAIPAPLIPKTGMKTILQLLMESVFVPLDLEEKLVDQKKLNVRFVKQVHILLVIQMMNVKKFLKDLLVIN